MQIKVTKAHTWKDKIVGLIGKKEITSLYFETRWGIHTFGVRKPIDVVILDNEGTIRALKENLHPNRIFLWNPKFCRVIELPQGSITRLTLKIATKVITTSS